MSAYDETCTERDPEYRAEMARRRVYDDVRTERIRQDALAAAGRWDGESMATISDDRRLRVLVEEIGEVARALEEDDSQLRVELVQVAAVAVAWLEAFDLTGATA